MFIKQISVSLENMPGMLSNISELLGKEGVNIRAISVADTSDISTVRFVVDDPVKALNILRGNGCAVKETDVLAVECPDHPGGVNAVLKPLKNERKAKKRRASPARSSSDQAREVDVA